MTTETAKINKLAAVSDLCDKYVSNCTDNYSPGLNVTVDEMLMPFRGRWAFRMYMSNKPAKYGLKVQNQLHDKSRGLYRKKDGIKH